MSNIAIRVDDLSKQYRIGGPQQQFDRLGEQLVHAVAAPVRRARRLLTGQASSAAELDSTIWALQDVSIEIEHGEAVGIIGRNGAGKTTLLKILSQITAPTSGTATIRGRVGSLLEVGTGFHPELTGRENVYLNGAILGMSRAEIDRKFDEIVAFSEIEEFIDTPVKHYSSGMYVRLAFSVAAHLEPEILLIDEVLAVGDVGFQKKCLGKMGDVAQEGRTVLFVSHNIGLVQNLCERGIFLERGEVLAAGPICQVVDKYIRTLEEHQSEPIARRTDRRGAGQAKIADICVTDQEGSPPPLRSGGTARFRFQVDHLVPRMSCNFLIYDHLGQPVARFSSMEHGPEDIHSAERIHQFTCEIDELLLLPGRYRIDVYLTGDGVMQDSLRSGQSFDVLGGQIRGRPAEQRKAFRVGIPHRWVSPVT